MFLEIYRHRHRRAAPPPRSHLLPVQWPANYLDIYIRFFFVNKVTMSRRRRSRTCGVNAGGGAALERDRAVACELGRVEPSAAIDRERRAGGAHRSPFTLTFRVKPLRVEPGIWKRRRRVSGLVATEWEKASEAIAGRPLTRVEDAAQRGPGLCHTDTLRN